MDRPELDGVDANLHEELLAALKAAPPGTFDAIDLAEPSTVSLAIALVAAMDLAHFGRALPPLLARVRANQERLSDYDLGRYWHLRALVAWKIEANGFAATRAFIKAERYLITTGEREHAYLARVHDTWGAMLHATGLLLDARVELERALHLREHGGDTSGLGITLGNLGRLLLDLGDFDAARSYLERDLALIERGLPEEGRARGQVLTHLAQCALATGDVASANHHAMKAVSLAHDRGDALGQWFAEIQLARCALHRDDAVAARSFAMAILERLDATRETSPAILEDLRALAEHVLADVDMHEGRLSEATVLYRRAYGRLERSTRASPLQRADVLVGLSRALSRSGHEHECGRVLRDALGHLDATAAAQRRRQVEDELKATSPDAWLLHAAGRFIGQQHIERALAEAGAEGFRGQRREVVALFSDIRGFTTLAEAMNPDELVALLNDLLTRLTRCVETHGGTVDKFIGDAVMAIFPADGPKSDGPALAALSMQAEIARFNRGLARPMTMGIGIHAGAAIAGLMGSPQKREYTAIGDVINTASRFEGMTKPLGVAILISEEVVHRLADPRRFLLRPLGRYAPKGRATGVNLFDLMGDEEDGTASVLSEIDAMREALESFRTRAFASAREALETLRQSSQGNPRDAVYALLRDQAEAFTSTPPPHSWDGTVVMTSK